jgi:serine/threonine protein kinase
VYEAEHLTLGRRFAVKVLCGHVDSKARDRFRREWRTIARLNSEYVVSVIDCGELSDGTPYLVMERLNGSDLRQLLEEAAPLPIPRAVAIVEHACLGVAAAHRAGVVHRDLKPANLFVIPRETGDELCKVLDFGVAKVDTSETTQQGTVIGTIKYMAPEQLTDSASVGPPADVYALGAILYECLTGAPPHVSATLQETMFKIVNQSAAPLSERHPNAPLELVAIVARALSRRPDQRFASAHELGRALHPFSRPVPPPAAASSGHDTTMREGGVGTAHGLRSDRGARRWLTGALSGVVAGVGVSWLLDLPGPASREPSGRQSEAAASTRPVVAASPAAQSAATVVQSSTAASPGSGSDRSSLTVPARAGQRPHPDPSAPSKPARAGESPPLVRFDRKNPYE